MANQGNNLNAIFETQKQLTNSQIPPAKSNHQSETSIRAAKEGDVVALSQEALDRARPSSGTYNNTSVAESLPVESSQPAKVVPPSIQSAELNNEINKQPVPGSIAEANATIREELTDARPDNDDTRNAAKISVQADAENLQQLADGRDLTQSLKTTSESIASQTVGSRNNSTDLQQPDPADIRLEEIQAREIQNRNVQQFRQGLEPAGKNDTDQQISDVEINTQEKQDLGNVVPDTEEPAEDTQQPLTVDTANAAQLAGDGNTDNDLMSDKNSSTEPAVRVLSPQPQANENSGLPSTNGEQVPPAVEESESRQDEQIEQRTINREVLNSIEKFKANAGEKRRGETNQFDKIV